MAAWTESLRMRNSLRPGEIRDEGREARLCEREGELDEPWVILARLGEAVDDEEPGPRAFPRTNVEIRLKGFLSIGEGDGLSVGPWVNPAEVGASLSPGGCPRRSES